MTVLSGRRSFIMAAAGIGCSFAGSWLELCAWIGLMGIGLGGTMVRPVECQKRRGECVPIVSDCMVRVRDQS